MTSKSPEAIWALNGISRSEYDAIHRWMRATYGKADLCEGVDCKGITKRFEWALKQGCRYSFDRDVFIRLCRSCHRKYDMEDGRIPKTISLGRKALYLKACKQCGGDTQSPHGICQKCYGLAHHRKRYAEKRGGGVRKWVHKTIKTNTQQHVEG